MQLNPVANFRKTNALANYMAGVANNEMFQQAATTVLASMAQSCGGKPNGEHKLAGASEAIDLLMSLWQEPKTERAQGGLDYKAQ